MELKTVGGWERLNEKVMLVLFSLGIVKKIPGSRGECRAEKPQCLMLHEAV